MWRGSSSLYGYRAPGLTRTGKSACATKALANGKLSHRRSAAFLARMRTRSYNTEVETKQVNRDAA